MGGGGGVFGDTGLISGCGTGVTVGAGAGAGTVIGVRIEDGVTGADFAQHLS